MRARSAQVELARPPQIVPGGEAVKNDFSLVEGFMRLLLEAASRSAVVRHHRRRRRGAWMPSVSPPRWCIAGCGRCACRPPCSAQNDAGVGVKNGVNFLGGKNAIGTFAPPFAVLNDFEFLLTLPDRDWLCGVAEAFKVAIIRDRAFFDWTAARAPSVIPRAISRRCRRLVVRCAEIHLEHIRTNGDPFEYGRARPLDFGHWSAHKLELMSGFRISHGEAVATGVLLDSIYAAMQGWLTAEELALIRDRAAAERFPRSGSTNSTSATRRASARSSAGLRDFQEHLGGELTVTFPRGLGARHEVHEIDLAMMERALQELQSFRAPCMIVQHHPPLHLTYCLNIHPGESWAGELRGDPGKGARGETNGRAGRMVRARAAHRASGGGRARRRARHCALRRCDFFSDHQLYPFTINGFPYGRFHAGPGEGEGLRARLAHPGAAATTRCSSPTSLTDWLPDQVDGSISTVPWFLQAVDQTDADKVQRWRRISPPRWLTSQRCAMTPGRKSTSGSSRSRTAFSRRRRRRSLFSRTYLLTGGLRRARSGSSVAAGARRKKLMRRHLGVCFDTCHVALQYEDLVESLRAYRVAGIRISKVQLSAALHTDSTPECWEALRRFVEPVYLHQVKGLAKSGARFAWFDLPDALAELPRFTDVETLRVHFHVPLFFTGSGPLQSTAAELTPEFFHELRGGECSHLEIETYTFDVLPQELRATDVVRSISREYSWVLQRLDGGL